MGFLQWEIQVAFPRESQLQQCHATQPTVHAGCFNVSIIHKTLTWTMGSLTCAKMYMHAKRTGVCGPCDIICTNGESNLCRQCASPMLYQLSSILNEYRLDWTSFWMHDWFLCHSKKIVYVLFSTVRNPVQWPTLNYNHPISAHYFYFYVLSLHASRSGNQSVMWPPFTKSHSWSHKRV